MRLAVLRPAFLAGLFVFTVAMCFLALSTGEISVNFDQVVAILLDEIGIETNIEFETRQATIVNVIRLPRVMMGVLIGGTLAAASAALQGVFRNPLADPGVIGISSGAAFVTAIALVITADLPDNTSRSLVPALACVGAGLMTVLMYRLSTVGGYTSIATMLLIGIAVNALTGAGLGILVSVINDVALRNVEFWAFGSLARANQDSVLTMLPFAVLSLSILPFIVRPLNVILLGESTAGHLGINVRLLRTLVMTSAALSIGAGVAFAGVISFLGLAVPHALRLVIGADHRFVLPGSVIFGAGVLVGADLFARTIAAPTEVPIGIVTALIGAPFFLWLLLQDRKRGVLL